MTMSTRRFVSIVLAVTALCMSPLPTLRANNDQWGLTLGYYMAIPVSAMHDFVDRYSWQGLGGEVTYLATESDHIGFAAGWQRFDGLYRDALSEFAGGAVYGTQVRSITALPLLIKATHTIGDPIQKIRPYLSLGAGAYVVTEVMDVGLYEFSSTNVHLGFMPAVGLNFRLGYRNNLLLQVDYNAALSSGTNVFGRTDNHQNYIGLKALLHFGR